MNFDQWWDEIGSGFRPEENDDMESHAQRLAKAAWIAAGGAVETTDGLMQAASDFSGSIIQSYKITPDPKTIIISHKNRLIETSVDNLEIKDGLWVPIDMDKCKIIK